jgi:formylglycine-generating enzyme required for sulfatase activity
VLTVPRSARFLLLGALGLGAASALLGCDGESSAAVGAAPSSAASTPGTSAAPRPSASASASSSSAPKRPPLPKEDLEPTTLREQREAMFERMTVMLGYDDATMARVRAIFDRSVVIGQGNPESTEHPMTRKECRERREAAKLVDVDHPRCGAAFMAPAYDPGRGETADTAPICVDRYEFPNIPCEYPVTFVTAREAAELCQAVGKRLCDAHEWEGACAGAVLPAEREYAWGKGPRKEQKHRHNGDREIRWSYGATKDHTKCATNSSKSKKCTASGGFKHCGSNTYPAGAFPECVSPFGVYDLHGNAAEHMNLALRPEELASRGGMGETEMKGSWFIFTKYQAHDDDCRWRAPDWHATKVMSPKSHLNYHLGFRCCKDVGPAAAPRP